MRLEGTFLVQTDSDGIEWVLAYDSDVLHAANRSRAGLSPRRLAGFVVRQWSDGRSPGLRVSLPSLKPCFTSRRVFCSQSEHPDEVGAVNKTTLGALAPN